MKSLYEIPVVFHFKVEVAGFGADMDTFFQEVSGLAAEVTTEDFREGGVNDFVHRLPTGTKRGNLVLRRGFLADSQITDWCRDAIESFHFAPCDVDLTLLDEQHQPLVAWNFKHAYPVKWSVSDLGAQQNALVVESRAIKQEDPPYNRAQTRYVERPWLRLDPGEAYPRITAQVLVRSDGARYFGPLKSRRQAASLIEIMERVFRLRNCSQKELDGGRRCLRGDMGHCLMPCERPDPAAYAAEHARVASFLEGDVDEVVAELEADMAHAAAALDFETAARVRDWIQLLDDLVVEGGAIAEPVDGLDRAVWLCREGEDHATAALLRAGILAWTARLPVPTGAGNLEHIHASWERAVQAPLPEGDPTGREEVDARRVLEHWMFVYRDELVVVDRRAGEAPVMWAQRIMAAVTARAGRR